MPWSDDPGHKQQRVAVFMKSCTEDFRDDSAADIGQLLVPAGL
jgi:hypothetical protein